VQGDLALLWAVLPHPFYADASRGDTDTMYLLSYGRREVANAISSRFPRLDCRDSYNYSDWEMNTCRQTRQSLSLHRDHHGDYIICRFLPGNTSKSLLSSLVEIEI
jgi:hypothetical protein